MCKTLEVKQKRVKLVDASKRRGCESACGEGRESRGRAGLAGANGKWAQKRQVRTHFRLEGVKHPAGSAKALQNPEESCGEPVRRSPLSEQSRYM